MDIPQELVERMVALVRDLSTCDGTMTRQRLDNGLIGRAKDIAALLPEPVDPDLIEARKIAAGSSMKVSEPLFNRWHDRIFRGEVYQDEASGVPAVLRGIKRGRELASKDTPTHG